MYDHLNSGILNGGRVGPGLNMGRVDPDLTRLCSVKYDYKSNVITNKQDLRTVQHKFQRK